MERGSSLSSSPLQVVQNSYVVRDLDEACARFHRMYGIGPFLGGSEGELSQHSYRGRPAPPIRMRGVFVQSGDLNLELVQILSDGPDAFTDMYPDSREGLHHVAIFCPDYEAIRDGFVAEAMPIASEFHVALVDATICYIDARPALGHMIELYPENATIREMFAATKRAAATWDRRMLIQPWN